MASPRFLREGAKKRPVAAPKASLAGTKSSADGQVYNVLPQPIGAKTPADMSRTYNQ